MKKIKTLILIFGILIVMLPGIVRADPIHYYHFDMRVTTDYLIKKKEGVAQINEVSVIREDGTTIEMYDNTGDDNDDYTNEYESMCGHRNLPGGSSDCGLYEGDTVKVCINFTYIDDEDNVITDEVCSNVVLNEEDNLCDSIGGDTGGFDFFFSVGEYLKQQYEEDDDGNDEDKQDTNDNPVIADETIEVVNVPPTSLNTEIIFIVVGFSIMVIAGITIYAIIRPKKENT